MVMPPPKQQPTMTGYINLERFIPVEVLIPRINAISRAAAPVLERNPDMMPENITIAKIRYRSLLANFVSRCPILSAPPVWNTASPMTAIAAMIMAVLLANDFRAVSASMAPIRKKLTATPMAVTGRGTHSVTNSTSAARIISITRIAGSMPILIKYPPLNKSQLII